MPELPDLTVYQEHLNALLVGHPLAGLRIANPFVLRSVAPAPAALLGRRLGEVRLIGKRIAFCFEGEHAAVVHLMVLGRLQWRKPGVGLGRDGLAALDFEAGSVVLTETGSKRRASLTLVGSAEELADLDPGGLDPLRCSEAAFIQRLSSGRWTLKRALTDPRNLAGVGNAYSDEILFQAQLSPVTLTTSLSGEAWQRLFAACQEVLTTWTARLRAEAGAVFPKRVTAFHEMMAVHGRFRQPCPRCGDPVQRIVRAENEVNYCATCQTGGRLLADRALSSLLKSDWPRSLDAWEERMERLREPLVPAAEGRAPLPQATPKEEPASSNRDGAPPTRT